MTTPASALRALVPAVGILSVLLAVPFRGAPVPLPAPPVIHAGIGTISLLDTRLVRIGYRLDGSPGETVLGIAWQGEDRRTGVQFRPEAIRNGRRTWFMHCPWRIGPGTTFADYRLAIPPRVPARLDIAVGLREDAPHSDGVTFLVFANGRRIFSRHCTWKGLREFTIPLPPEVRAKEEITLQLAVDPGPARNTTDDWAIWGRADLLVGSRDQIARALKQKEEEARARRRGDFARAGEIAAESLLLVSGPEARSVRPSTLRQVKNRVSESEDGTVFQADDGRERLRYIVKPDILPLAGVRVFFNDRECIPPPFTGGMTPGPRLPPGPLRLQSARFDEREEVLRCAYGAGKGKRTVLEVVWSIEGKSLRAEFSAPAGFFTGISLATTGDCNVTAPLGPAAAWRDREGVYTSITADYMHSNASAIGAGGSTYRPLTDHTYNPLHDVFYFTVSSRYAEVLGNSPWPPSPFLGDLSHRVILDVWGGRFSEDAAWLQRMAQYGVNRFVVIKHVWQRDGYDMTYPDTMPANAGLGGDAGLRQLAQTAIRIGHRFCVHENYYDYYPNAEDFREEDCALNPDGSKQKGWQGSPVKAWILKPSRLMAYVRRFSPEIRRRYGCNAAYHDIMPTHRVDYEAGRPGAGMIRYTHQVTRELVEFDHRLFGGPVLFEGLGTTLAGLYDGGTSGPLNEEHMPVAVAPELIIVHPKQSNHGMSYYERWLEWGYGPGWSSYVMTSRERDHYRAMTIAFGRTGFIGHQLMRTPHGVVREYHLFQAFGRAYTGRRVTHIRYEGDEPGQWLDAGTAARYNWLERLWITYEGDQQVYVNLGAADWHVADHVLPPFGVLTRGPRATAWTARIGGQVADFARYDDITFVDARSHWWQPPVDPHPILARAVDFKDLGGGRFRIAVEWRPGRPIGKDRIIFWHFRDRRKIRFQHDHRPGVPTSRWQPGAARIDGPAALRVPEKGADRYTFVAGLYDRTDRERLYANATEAILGTLEVIRAEDGTVRKVRFVPAKQPWPPGTDPEPYAEDANRTRRVLDFGEIACNGALVVRHEAGGLTATPVPIGEDVLVGIRGDVRRVVAEGPQGPISPAVPLERHNGRTWFHTRPPDAVRFRIER